MTHQDKHLWDLYIRDVAPVKKPCRKAPAPSTDKEAAAKTAARRAAALLPVPMPKFSSAAAELKELLQPLERKREKSLRQGSVEIDGKLDLHGMTQVEAFAALARFMRKKVKAGKRHLLIITGKGRGGEGVLRRNLQQWLGQLPEAAAILALRPAAVAHGGDGAFYVVLRRKSGE